MFCVLKAVCTPTLFQSKVFPRGALKNLSPKKQEVAVLVSCVNIPNRISHIKMFLEIEFYS